MKALILLIFIYACGASTQKEGQQAPATMTVSDTIRAKPNEQFTIKLITSMGTGYSWTTTDSAYSKNMSLDSVTVISNTEGKEDGADQQVFHFRALAKSTTLLHFIRKRPWEGTEKADKQKKFTVIIE
jgi:predicted secreted protein